MKKPIAGQYNPYFQTYINEVPEGNFLSILKTDSSSTIDFLKKIPAEKHDFSYLEGKWTVKEVLMHLIDVERVMSYRAFVAARGDNQTPLHSMDDELYLKNSNASTRNMNELIDEFEAVRNATEKFFQTVTEEQSQFLANGVSYSVSASAMGYVIVGHTIHHIRVMKEKYL